MNDSMNIVQLRSTIFLPQNIGYTPENAERFKKSIFGDTKGKVYGIVQPSMPVMLGVNPSLPQYGLPWRIFRRFDNGDEYNIAFQMGKIDIVLAKNVSYDNDVELDFCKRSTEYFSCILDTLGSNAIVTRIAYAPLYAFNKSGAELDAFWNNLLRKTVFDGTKSQDINLSFLLKRPFKFGGKTAEINLLHNIFDGTLTTNENDTSKNVPVILFQLDLNSVPEEALELGKSDVSAFFVDEILTIKEGLVTNVSK